VPLTDLKALSINNVRWPLSNRDVPLGATLTLSNETIGDPHMTLRSGEALVLAYPA
jgi:thiamine pyrophosphokinase